MLTKDQAICIRAIDYSETSQIVTLLGRDTGKVGAMAKGSRRAKSAFDGPIEVFSHGPVVFSEPGQGGSLVTVTEFQQRYDVVRGLAVSLPAYHGALLAVELVDKLTHERDSHPEIFDALLAFLQAVVTIPGAGNREVLALGVTFQGTLLRDLGLALVWQACANCRRPYTVDWPSQYFSSQAHGLVCRDCEGSFPDRVVVTSSMARGLVEPKALATADRHTLQAIQRLLIGHFSQLLHYRPRMAKYVLATKE